MEAAAQTPTPDDEPKTTGMSDAGQAPADGAKDAFGLSVKADSELLSRVVDFWKAHRDSREKEEKSGRLHKGIKAPTGGGGGSPEHKAWEAEAERCGYSAAMEAWNEANTKAGAAAKAGFSIPAHTLRGGRGTAKAAGRSAMGTRPTGGFQAG